MIRNSLLLERKCDSGISMVAKPISFKDSKDNQKMNYILFGNIEAMFFEQSLFEKFELTSSI